MQFRECGVHVWGEVMVVSTRCGIFWDCIRKRGIVHDYDGLVENDQGFWIRCKCGNVDKTEWGIKGEDKIIALLGKPDANEVGCNPIVQAEILNSEKTDLNIIVGLCIGHDIQFNNYSDAPVTTLIVKDRVTGHNPFATLYSDYHHPRMWKEE